MSLRRKPAIPAAPKLTPLPACSISFAHALPRDRSSPAHRHRSEPRSGFCLPVRGYRMRVVVVVPVSGASAGHVTIAYSESVNDSCGGGGQASLFGIN